MKTKKEILEKMVKWGCDYMDESISNFKDYANEYGDPETGELPSVYEFFMVYEAWNNFEFRDFVHWLYSDIGAMLSGDEFPEEDDLDDEDREYINSELLLKVQELQAYIDKKFCSE